MKDNRTLVEWIRWYHQTEQRRLETRDDATEAVEADEVEELFTVIVPSGAPTTDIGDDLAALNGIRWSFEITMVPGPETVQ